MSIVLPTRGRTAPSTGTRRARTAVCAALGVWPRVVGLVSLVLAGTTTADVRAIVASGLGGTAAYAERFEAEADAIAAALATLDSAPGAVQRLSAPGRDELLQAIESAGAAASEGAAPASLFALVLVGHGTHDPDGYHFNLPGDDLDEAMLAGSLATVTQPRQLLIVATSASGALLDTFDQPGRVLVTATRSAGEVNAVQFPRHLAAAVRDGAADLDRNEILTVDEAFRFASAGVRRGFEEEKLLVSEHPSLAGDGGDTLALARLGALATAADDPVVAALLDDRGALESDFIALRARKDSLDASDYYRELETLALKIARLQRDIDAATGWSEPDAGS